MYIFESYKKRAISTTTLNDGKPKGLQFFLKSIHLKVQCLQAPLISEAEWRIYGRRQAIT